MAEYLIDYYLLLGLERDASREEIEARLKERQRLWRQRENAPRPEHREQAERNSRLVPVIRGTLLGEDDARAEYDRKLQAQERQRGDDPGSDALRGRQVESEALFSEARRLAAEGNVADALMAATTLARREGDDAEAWALLGHCQGLWGETGSAVGSYEKAISLRPNEAGLYYELGGLHEQSENYGEAVRQYGRAAQIDRGNAAYRAAIGSAMAASGRWEEAVPILEECVEGEPGNAGFSSLLGRCYYSSAVGQWKSVGDGEFVITSADHVESARRFARKIRDLVPSAADLDEVAGDLEGLVKEATARRFEGSVPLIALAAFSALFIAGLLGNANGWLAGLFLLYMVGCSVSYGLSSITLQYRWNELAVAGKQRVTLRNWLRAMRDPRNRRTMLRETLRGWMDDLRLAWLLRTPRAGGGGGCMSGCLAVMVVPIVLLFASLFIVPFLLPILTLRNLFRNRAVTVEVVRGLYQQGQALFQRGR